MNEGDDRLRLLWADLLGLARGKYVPRAELDHPARFCVSAFTVGHDLEMVAMPGYAADSGMPDMHAVLDPDTLRPGWEPATSVGIATLMGMDGEPVPLDPRACLRRAVARWEERGLTPQVGFEMELYLMEADGNGAWLPLAAPGHRVYGTGPQSDPAGVTDAIMRAAAAAGLPVEGMTSEYFSAQIELNLHYDDAVKAADDAFLFRLLAREVAGRMGYGCTFLGRPFADRGGNGLHVNVSFRTVDGANALVDADGPDGLSSLARHAIGGQLEHHASLAAICAPTVNAYKRLLPGMLNGFYASWGHDNRTAAVRVPAARGPTTRLESRVADGAANPYLAAATVLAACHLGVEAGREPPEPQIGDGDTAPVTERTVPRSLEAALDALEADEDLVEALGPELVSGFLALKRSEWARFATAVTDWEVKEYLPFY